MESSIRRQIMVEMEEHVQQQKAKDAEVKAARGSCRLRLGTPQRDLFGRTRSTESLASPRSSRQVKLPSEISEELVSPRTRESWWKAASLHDLRDPGHDPLASPRNRRLAREAVAAKGKGISQIGAEGAALFVSSRKCPQDRTWVFFAWLSRLLDGTFDGDEFGHTCYRSYFGDPGTKLQGVLKKLWANMT
ncbi:unnamed protein product [Effrenium voratum]|nr:unnamed protein product [Effrenium voratum]